MGHPTDPWGPPSPPPEPGLQPADRQQDDPPVGSTPPHGDWAAPSVVEQVPWIPAQRSGEQAPTANVTVTYLPMPVGEPYAQPWVHPQPTPYPPVPCGQYQPNHPAPRPSRAPRAIGITTVLLVLLIGIATAVAVANKRTVQPYAEPAVVATVDMPSGSGPVSPRTWASQSPAPRTDVQITVGDIDALTTQRSEALQKHDLTAFLAAVDPRKSELVTAQMQLFGNLEKLPLTVREYLPIEPKPSASKPNGSVSTELDVVFSHQLTGYDAAPVVEVYHWALTRSEPNGPLLITNVTGAKSDGDNGTLYYPAPWDLWKDMQVVKADRVMVLVDKPMLATSQKYAPLAAESAEEVVAAWKAGRQSGEVHERFVLSLVPNNKGLASLYRTVKGGKVPEDGVTIALPRTGTPPSTVRTGGTRVAMQTDSPDFSRSQAGAAEIFRHEFTHAMIEGLNAYAHDGKLDSWVVEGFAEYVANRRPGTVGPRLPGAKAAIRKEPVNGLPTNAGWNDRDVSFHYYLGHQAMRYIRQKYGEPKVFEFVSRCYTGSSTDESITTTLGVSASAFEKNWVTFVRAATG